MGAREWIALAALGLAVLGLLWRMAAAATQTKIAAEQAATAIESVRQEIAKSLEGIRDAMEGLRKLTQEALRQAQAAHVRVDKVQAEQQRLSEDFIRLDERTRHWLTTTQRMRGTASEEKRGE